MATNTVETFSDNFSIFPTKEDLETWESLNRDEQIEHFQQEIQQARESGIGSLTADQIKQRALSSRDQ